MTAQVRRVAIDEIHPHPSNPKAHDLSTLTRSIQRFGFVEPIVVDQRTSLNISGHGRVEALTALHDQDADLPDGITTDPDGRWLAPVFVGWSSANDAEAEAALVALNRIGEAGGWDDRALADLLGRLDGIDGGMDGIGYGEDDLAALREQLDALEQDGDDPAWAESGGLLAISDLTGGEPRTLVDLGDVWKIDGRHTLVIASVFDGHATWGPHLDSHDLFAPYPEPFLTLTPGAAEVSMLLVQPDKHLAGHLLDRHREGRGDDAAVRTATR